MWVFCIRGIFYLMSLRFIYLVCMIFIYRKYMENSKEMVLNEKMGLDVCFFVCVIVWRVYVNFRMWSFGCEGIILLGVGF